MQNTMKSDADGSVLQKPVVISNYNSKICGIDTNDQQLHRIQVLEKT